MRFPLSLVLGLLGLGCFSVSQAAQVIVHDPAMAQEGKTFYVFSTGPGLPFYSSTDLKNWKKEGTVFIKDPQITQQAVKDYVGFPWAPDVYFHNGKYYVYFAVSAFGKNTSAIGVVTNKTLNPKSPDFKWEEQGMVLQSIPNRDEWNAIDAAIIEDEKGTAWMSFGSFWSGIKLVKLNQDRTRIAEPQEWYSLAERERDLINNSPNTNEQPNEPPKVGAVEAPFIFKKGNYYYLFVSFDFCCQKEKSTYNIRVGRSQTLTGPYLDKDGKDMSKGGGSLVLAGDKDYVGLGHNSAYQFNGKDYLVFHAYDNADKYEPKLKILEMKWDKNNWPTVDSTELKKYQSQLINK